METAKLVDNMVPGAGTYDPDPKHPVPSYLIKSGENVSRNKDKDQERKSIGPHEYSPKWPHELSPSKVPKGISFGKSVRKEEAGTNKFTPAPTTYTLLGDFDF